MAVCRIVADIACDNPADVMAFYKALFDLDTAMDMGWIVTGTSQHTAAVQISFASEGGSGTEVPDLSIEVDNFDEILQRLDQLDIKPEYGPVLEPWGVRRVYVRDPVGKLLNILTHEEK